MKKKIIDVGCGGVVILDAVASLLVCSRGFFYSMLMWILNKKNGINFRILKAFSFTKRDQRDILENLN